MVPEVQLLVDKMLNQSFACSLVCPAIPIEMQTHSHPLARWCNDQGILQSTDDAAYINEEWLSLQTKNIKEVQQVADNRYVLRFAAPASGNQIPLWTAGRQCDRVNLYSIDF